MINKLRGTQDFLDTTLFNFIVETTRTLLLCNNFQEIQTPIIEPVDLFKRSLGLETDVVTKQMFIIAAQEESMCLRPEATASTMRAFLEHHITQTPWKVFSYGPMFRYERPQKGRYRQFHQFNMEVIGSSAIAYDAYFISLLDRLFTHSFLLENYALIINFLGCPADRVDFKQHVATYLNPLIDALCVTCQRRTETNILRIFDCKESTCQQHYAQAPTITQHLCAACSTQWRILQDTLDALSVSYTYVPTLVRGLDYYDKTVFEFVSSNLGAQAAFCGGGRYNHLATQLGSDTDLPSLGASFGIERLLLLLEPLRNRLPLAQAPTIVAIIPMSDEQHTLALLLADELQTHRICVDVLLDNQSVKSALRKADKMGARSIIIIGSQEQEQGTVVVKNMQTGTQEIIAQTELVKYLKQ